MVEKSGKVDGKNGMSVSRNIETGPYLHGESLFARVLLGNVTHFHWTLRREFVLKQRLLCIGQCSSNRKYLNAGICADTASANSS